VLALDDGVVLYGLDLSTWGTWAGECDLPAGSADNVPVFVGRRVVRFHWDLGPIRNKGSIHSDIWRGSAAELARRDYLAIYPVGGWWKEKPDLQRFDRDVRYSLSLSIRALAAQDIYTPIANTIETPVQITIG
jgi:hypothetical protein